MRGVISLARRPAKAAARPAVGWLSRLITKLGLLLGGEPARRRRRAQNLARGLSAELHRLGLSRRAAVGGHRRRKVRLQRVRFDPPLLLTRDELWLPIDLARLPVGVRSNDLREEDALRSIEDRLNTSARVDYLATGKMCFVLRLGGMAFPEVFRIGSVKMSPDAPALEFPIGIDGQGEQRFANIARLPHLLIVGPTQKGKSTLIHTIITTLISRNSAIDAELWLCDHKGGVELDRYRELMGTKTRPGIVRRISYQPETTIELLLTAFNEMERRNEVLRQAGSSDVDDYGKMTGQHMRRIVIIIDEIFLLMLNKDKIDPEVGKSGGKGRSIGDWAEHLFAKIASTGRAAGIHLIIATQKTGKDVLTSMITGNFETRIVFGVADMYQSVYILGDSSAVGLPRGRIIFREEGGHTTEVQTPLIKPDQVRLLINRISRYGPDGGLGRDEEARKFCEDAKLLITIASEEFEGRMAISQIWQHERIKGALRKERVEEICKRLQKDGVLSAGGPRQARMVNPGFLGRPQLLDVMYGPNAVQPGALPFDDPLPPAGEPPAAPEAPEPPSGPPSLAQEPQELAQDGASEEDADLGPWRKLLDDLDSANGPEKQDE